MAFFRKYVTFLAPMIMGFYLVCIVSDNYNTKHSVHNKENQPDTNNNIETGEFEIETLRRNQVRHHAMRNDMIESNNSIIFKYTQDGMSNDSCHLFLFNQFSLSWI